jgi:hypothetical protein
MGPRQSRAMLSHTRAPQEPPRFRVPAREPPPPRQPLTAKTLVLRQPDHELHGDLGAHHQIDQQE